MKVEVNGRVYLVVPSRCVVCRRHRLCRHVPYSAAREVWLTREMCKPCATANDGRGYSMRDWPTFAPAATKPEVSPFVTPDANEHQVLAGHLRPDLGKHYLKMRGAP